jgi:hypothetical protein
MNEQDIEKIREAFDEIRVMANRISQRVEELAEILGELPAPSAEFKAETFTEDVTAALKGKRRRRKP